MKQNPFILIFTVIFLTFAGALHAEILKTITLKDGSVLKGKVLQLSNGIYTLETSNLGQVDIPESNILSINSFDEASASLNPQNIGKSIGQTGQLQNEIQQMQGKILSDPGLSADLQTLLNDKTIQAMLSDPQTLEAIMSYDPEKIQQNPNIQKLMENPKMLELMNKIQEKMSAP